jgi:transposase
MYIRRTHTSNSATGERYATHRLVQSERVGGRVRQVTLLNLGRHFALPQEEWPALCARVEELRRGQGTLLGSGGAALEREAQRLSARLLAREGEDAPIASRPAGGEVQAVDVDSLELSRPRSVGVESVALWAMAEVKFTQLLQDLGLSGPQRSLIVGAIIGRMAAPGSERATHRWLSERSGLGELLEVDFEAMALAPFYRAADLLMRHRAVIEQTVFARVSDLFGLDWTVTLYDLTNTFFEGAALGNPKAQRGHSKEKRRDCPLVTLGLVLDGSGFVRRSQTFDGQVTEGTTLEGMLEGLGAPRGALVVMDAGIATEENIQWLRTHGYRYLVVSRERQRQFDAAAATALTTASGDALAIQRVVDADAEEVRLYCFSECRARKEEGISERFTQRFEAALQALHEGLARPRTTKAIDKLWERIGRLKATSHGVGQHYAIEIVADATGKTAQAIRWERQPVAGTMLTHPGVYCLRTNEMTWDAERLWRTYVTLTDLESVFRSLKSELGLRPVYHRTEGRVDGHLFISVLAYQFVQLIRRRLRTQGISERWSTLRDTLAGQCRVTTTFRRADGRTLHVRKATRAEPAQLAIIQALGSDASPGGIQKMVV